MSSIPEQQSGSERDGSTQGAEQGHGFGTSPVFLASISTILGAILFLRFGYAVGHVGLWGSFHMENSWEKSGDHHVESILK